MTSDEFPGLVGMYFTRHCLPKMGVVRGRVVARDGEDFVVQIQEVSFDPSMVVSAGLRKGAYCVEPKKSGCMFFKTEEESVEVFNVAVLMNRRGENADDN